MAHALIRTTLWGINGLLLLAAVGAMFLWPWSHGHPGGVYEGRWTAGATRVDHVWLVAGWRDGRIGVRWNDVSVTKEPLDYVRRQATDAGPGWTFEVRPKSSQPGFTGTPSAWGPLRWQASDYVDDRYVIRLRTLALPCWLLALTAGVWLLASLTYWAYRRRRRARRLRSTHLCRQCGYDLRATPSASGARLATCPECGAASSAGS